MASSPFRRPWLLGLALLVTTPLAAAEVQIVLPLQRTAYQTNEWIDVSVVRSDKQPLAAATLTLTVKGADGSSVVTTFPAPAVPVQGKEARRVEHLHVNGWLLRPGKYTVEAAVDGAKASADIEVFTHLRQSSFRLVNWGRAQKEQQLVEGEDSFGFNLFYGDETKDNLLRAGVDAMGVCVMSGAHQMDIRMECDWSDPYVTRGGTRRVVRRALQDRTRPNVPGVHFYDEPGLTWHKHPVTGEFTPHEIPAQVRSYAAAYGKESIPHHLLDAKDPEQLARWKHWATWKLSLMDAAWKESQFGVSEVRPDFLSLTQSQYGWGAFTDGYYFNVARSLPITSGHGGYHDFGPGYFNPSYFLEMARARDQWKPCWYLPCWYGNTTSDQFRMEQYLSFQTGIQGMISPPDLEPATNPSARDGIVESNQLMKRLGPIFTTMAPTKPPVAMLYSLSQALHMQAESRGKINYLHEMPQGRNLAFTYLAGKLIQQPFLPVLEEDVLDGSVANDHKAIVLTSIDYLDPHVVQALEDFAAPTHGGLVLLTDDSTVQIKGAIKINVTPGLPDAPLMQKLGEQLKTEKDAKAKEALQRQLASLQSTAKHLAGALPLGQAIKVQLAKVGIKPLLESDVPSIIVTRHAQGDVEYLFAVNATPDSDAKDAKGNPNGITPKAVVATLTLADDNRPIYDAVRGGPVAEFKAKGGKYAGQFRFGPGEMRVFARTSRPIRDIKLATPVVARDLVKPGTPIQVKLAATVVDTAGELVAGAVPLHVQVINPLGVVRHELFRATDQGQFATALPLAANDPPGAWTVRVRDLLTGNDHPTITFEYRPPVRARAIAGATPRAVSFGDDRDKAFRFARTHHEVTIVKGKSAFNDAAAKRLAQILGPWGVRCKEVDLTEAAKARPLSEDEAQTWVGLVYAGKGQIKPGDKNPPALAGFHVRGPVILLGHPQDHPILEFLLKEKFLPYVPDAATFPGPGRGYFTWQRDAIGPGQESLALIAYDAEGMAEAVGTLYEAIAGIDPLTRWALPTSDTLTAAKVVPDHYPEMSVIRIAVLPDRVDALELAAHSLRALAHDGSVTHIEFTEMPFGPTLKAGEPRPASAEEAAKLVKESALALDQEAAALLKKQARPDRMQKLAAAGKDLLAVAYWGGTVRVVDRAGRIRAEQRLPQDVTALAWHGDVLLAGLADGRVLALQLDH